MRIWHMGCASGRIRFAAGLAIGAFLLASAAKAEQIQVPGSPPVAPAKAPAFSFDEPPSFVGGPKPKIPAKSAAVISPARAHCAAVGQQVTAKRTVSSISGYIPLTPGGLIGAAIGTVIGAAISSEIAKSAGKDAEDKCLAGKGLAPVTPPKATTRVVRSASDGSPRRATALANDVSGPAWVRKSIRQQRMSE